MKRFDYIRPGNMEDAIAALQANDEPYLLAGGTDLLIGMKTNAVKPKCLIDLKGIPDIDCIEYDNGFKLGALTTVRDVEVSPLIREKIPALSEAAGTLGSIQIRNRATDRRQFMPWVPGGRYGRHSSGNELRSKNCHC